jgi:hypothetical protein
VIDALPPPEILARLAGPQSTCVISLTRTDAESGDVTSAQCGRRHYAIARSYHGDNVRRVSRCSIMLMIEGVELPDLLHVSNCSGPLRIRHTGDMWTRELLASARIAPARLEQILYEPVAHRPSCYKVSVAFTLAGTATHTPFGDRSALRCD